MNSSEIRRDQRGRSQRAAKAFTPGDSELLRQPILDAARELFAKEGYESVSMRRIGAEVGCSPMAMYRYFGSKEELLISICEETFAQMMQARDAEADRQAAPIERLRVAVRAFIDFGIAHPNHYKLAFMTDIPSGPIARRRATIAQKALDGLRTRVKECIDAKALNLDVELTAQMVRVGAQGMISGSIIKTFVWKDKDRLRDKLIETLTRDLG